MIAGVLLYDYAYYWWHMLMHLTPFFWRFHNVHHTDLDMDVSTASRFHFGEVLLSIFFRVAVVGGLGLSVWTLAVYELLFSVANQFQHSNWRLPIAVERVLNLFSYTGAFSLYAVRAGASSVTSVDLSQPAARAARANFELNGFNPEAHEFLSEDVVEFLERTAQAGNAYSGVCSERPS